MSEYHTKPYPVTDYSPNNYRQTVDSIPPGWDLYIHPQGWVYFKNRQVRVVTDEDVRIPETLKSVEQYISSFPISELDEHMEILLPHGAMPGEHGLTLVVNHSLCIASHYLDEVRTTNVCKLDPYQVNRLHRLFWNYLQGHPAHVPTPANAEQEVRDALTWYHVDNLISGSRSTVPFSKMECEDLLKILNDTQVDWQQGSISRTVFLAWLSREIWSFRDAERYGQYTIKQSNVLRADRLRTGPASVTPLVLPAYISIPLDFVINVVFFAIPRTYLAHVKAASEYHGRLSSIQARWEQYIDRIVREYQDFLLIATVLLSANVSFLAINDLSPIATAAGIVSVFASLGSIIVGVFLHVEASIQ
ncbi:hypothetical protein EW146_g6354 [Bondarzewia mesenterica]|uniref:WW domain-containing protein n=1 Tax=Bondarzewia mesenterica TaxID=1095465 RepID=A0A4S4LNY7_9AGAM|nr:hypothetical protein EW146_g6354 [Bondarzewia mesenterica]